MDDLSINSRNLCENHFPIRDVVAVSAAMQMAWHFSLPGPGKRYSATALAFQCTEEGIYVIDCIEFFDEEGPLIQKILGANRKHRPKYHTMVESGISNNASFALSEAHANTEFASYPDDVSSYFEYIHRRGIFLSHKGEWIGCFLEKVLDKDASDDCLKALILAIGVYADEILSNPPQNSSGGGGQNERRNFMRPRKLGW